MTQLTSQQQQQVVEFFIQHAEGRRQNELLDEAAAVDEFIPRLAGITTAEELKDAIHMAFDDYEDVIAFMEHNSDELAEIVDAMY